MSIHINAQKKDIAEAVLLPGDPYRAKYIAENFLEQAFCYNEVRGMLGFTGTYKGKKVSVQGTGMGQPSAAIYINELINSYDAKILIRIGTCAGLSEDLPVRSVVVATSASTDSNMNKVRFNGFDYAATASADLLFEAYDYTKKHMKDGVCFCPVITSDTFYNDSPDEWKMWSEYGIYALEMETSQLYTLAAKYKRKALAIFTVSDNSVSKEETSSEEREKTFNDMIEMALHIV